MPAFDIAEVRDRGYGAIANRLIESGTLIVAESYIFKVPRVGVLTSADLEAIQNVVEGMSNKKKKRFAKLANSFTYLPPLEGIIKTNVMPLGFAAAEGGLFLTCCRFNHSCLSNAAYSWQADREQEVIYAVKDIAAGEEITVSYLRDDIWLHSKAERQRHLLEKFNFDCNCELCESDEHQILASDRRRSRISVLQAEVGDGKMIIERPSKALGYCKEILALLHEEGASYSETHSVYYDAFQICVANQDYARARSFALLCSEAVAAFQGQSSFKYLERRANSDNPEQHRLAGTTTRWKQQAKFAMGPETAGFDAWLWRRTG